MRARELTIAAAWVCLAMWSLPAAANTFAQDLRAYDFAGMGLAVLVSFTGGTFATLLSLMRDGLVLNNIWRELLKDIATACIAGAVTYILMAGFISLEVVYVPGPVKVGILFFAGWARMAFFAWFERNGKQIADRGAEWVASKIPKGE